MTTLKQIIEESDKEFVETFPWQQMDSYHELTAHIATEGELISFIHERDRKLIEGMRDMVKAKLDWWRSDGVVEVMAPSANLAAVTSLVEVYDLINQFLNQK